MLKEFVDTLTEEVRLTAANRVLQSFESRSEIAFKRNAGGRRILVIRWTLWHGKKYERQWMTRGQDFYPVWKQRWPGGGTACTALSQLVRWVQGKTVLPISTWRYWATDGIKLLKDESHVDILLAAGYPEHVDCVLCGHRIEGGLDWWSVKDVTGPCCGWRSGCRQTGKYDQET